MKLGKLTLKNRLILSPLEGVSDQGFRSLCHKNGAGLTFTEMIRADGLARKNKSTLALIDSFDTATPTGIQLVTNSYKDLKKALKTLEKLALDSEKENEKPEKERETSKPDYSHFNNLVGVDINFGCPSLDIINIGAGPAMLKRKQQLSDIFSYLHEFKETTSLKNMSFVGCKIRLGLNEVEKNNRVYENVLSIAASTDQPLLDYVTIHARHGKQRSSVQADWTALSEIYKNFNNKSIKLIGNGDIRSPYDLEVLMKHAPLDGFMVARGAIFNPWCFDLLDKYIKMREAYERKETDFAKNFPLNLLDEKILKMLEEENPFKFQENNKIKLLKIEESKYSQGTYCVNSWPNLSEISSAIKEYNHSVKKFDTKEKFSKFNKQNLTKIQVALKNNNLSGLKYSGPNSLNSL